MNKLLKTIFSMEIISVFLMFMALSCAIATFIENDFGPAGSKAFVYGQTWFELVMLILTIGIVFHIFWFKMYKKEKFFIFMIHISIVFIFVGSAMTRYLGYEAVMTIPEGAMENRVYSTDEYIQLNIDGKSYDKKVMMTPISQSNFEYQTILNNKPLLIKFNRFVQNATEKIIPVEDGKTMMTVFVLEAMGTHSLDLENQKQVDSKFITFTLNKKIETNSKPTVNFETINNEFFISSNIELASDEIIKPNTKTKLELDKLYKIGQTQFKISDAQINGALKVISDHSNQTPKDKQLNAVILDLTYDNKTIEVPLYGKGGSNHGITKKIVLDNKNVSLSWGTKEFVLPFSILLNDFKLERYPGSNSPSFYSSDVKVYDKKANNSFEFTIFMNNVLDYKGYRFFQSSYKMDESATILSVNKDPGKIPTYIGYFLLFSGLFLTLFMKNSRFKKLSSKKFTLEEIKNNYNMKKNITTIILLCISFLVPQKSFCSDEANIYNIDKNHSKLFGELIIQDYQGRIKPLNSLAIEIINKISKKDEVKDLDANQFFISMMLYPDIWKTIPIYKIKNDRIKELLEINNKENLFSFNDIYSNDGSYKLESELELANNKSASLRDEYEKELIKIDEILNISYSLFIGDFLKIFPIKNDENNKWLNINQSMQYEDSEYETRNNLIKEYYLSLLEATKTSNWQKPNSILNEIKNYQNSNSNIIPPKAKIDAELFFNKFNIFEKLTPFYLILGLTLLGLILVNIFYSISKIEKFTKITLLLLIVCFILHTIGLALRWYVSGHAPWSNGYESMIYIAWAIALSGIYFSRQSHLALATTSILSGITLFVAHLSWMEPQITTLAPVLKSYWLTIHVSVITASYGFLALSCLLGFISLVLFIFANPKNENERFFKILLSIKESNRINEMAILMGIVLLVIGNFLGGIWANESWGRYWGWDPKETWTLISIIIYSLIIHFKYIKNFMNEYLLSLLSVISYFSIIMTYFGVNYFLSGKHSYAKGDAVQIPDFVFISLFIILLTIILSYKNRKLI